MSNRRRRPCRRPSWLDGRPPVVVTREHIRESDITIVSGFRVTTLERTLVDVAGCVPPAEAARVIGQALATGRITVDELIDVARERTDLDSIDEFRIALALYLSGGARPPR